jgi:NMDA receptor-regulated protein 1
VGPPSCPQKIMLTRLSFSRFVFAAAVIKHFEDFHEDQFDFHSYCVRKVTLRAYTDVLRYEDRLWGEPYYGRAAEGTIGIYLHLFDHPSITAGEQEPDYSKMTAAEKKKSKAIVRKKKKAAEKKAEEEVEKQKKNDQEANENGSKTKKGQQEAAKDADPDGKELLKKDPLEEAKNYSAILAKHAPNRLSTWMFQYDVAIRRGKALLAMQVRRIGLFILPLVQHISFASRRLSTGLVQSSRVRCTERRPLQSHCGLCIKGSLVGNGSGHCPPSNHERVAFVAR